LIRVPRTNALLDTTPLWLLLEWMLGGAGHELPGIGENLRSGRLKAVALTTSSYSTGQSITWTQGDHVTDWERAHRRSRSCRLTVAHVMASAALPVLFPAVQIEGAWYGDGGVRLTSPLAPAVHLGAGRILAISTRYARTFAEADRHACDGYPPPAQIFGVLLNSIFLDLFDADALALERVNRLIEKMPEERRMGMRPVRLLMLRPSRDLGLLANEYEPHLPSALRFMTRGLGTKQTRSNDLLSLLMFQPDYLTRLVELGEKDARARSAEIEAFLAG
ncbi:MAG: patatin-like phospholipase family protein, partial [Planctomycetota bacterium]